MKAARKRSGKVPPHLHCSQYKLQVQALANSHFPRMNIGL